MGQIELGMGRFSFFTLKTILLLIHVDREKSANSIRHGAWRPPHPIPLPSGERGMTGISAIRILSELCGREEYF
jgi:hypothetical protein